MNAYPVVLAVLAATLFGCTVPDAPSSTAAATSSSTVADATATLGIGVCLAGGTGPCAGQVELRQLGTSKPISGGSGAVVGHAAGSLSDGQQVAWVFRIHNSAAVKNAGALHIDAIALLSGDGLANGAAGWQCSDPSGQQSCAERTGQWHSLAPAGLSSPANGLFTEESFRVRYKHGAASNSSAKVCVSLRGDPAYAGDPLCFAMLVYGKPAQLVVTPSTLNWPYVKPTEFADQTLQLANTGGAPLRVSSIEQIDVPGLSILNSDQSAAVAAPLSVVFNPPLTVAAGGVQPLVVRFAPLNATQVAGKLVVHSADPTAGPITTIIEVSANTATPCMAVNPTGIIQFGGVVPGGPAAELSVQIKNCGLAELVVSAIDFVKDQTNSTEFAIDYTPLAAKLSEPPPVSAANPLKLATGQAATFVVSYTPADITPDGGPPDMAVVSVKSNAGLAAKLTLQGVGIETNCPIAKATVQEGEQVVPQTVIHLKGDKSTAPGGGSIKKYKWTVKQPAGSNQPLLPNPSFANPTLLANASGEYEFCLHVWDGNDVKSCVTSCVSVLVIPNNALHLELLWDTPADPDQTDSGPAAGADFDLHFAHPLASKLDLDCDGAADPWFSNPWDTFWFNAAPEWGVAGVPIDNPTMDLDDTDGAGPENLNLVDPEGTTAEPVAYSLGVHYWHDHCYGTSYATMSIYIQGGLALQFTKIKLDPLDMWFVGKLNWPNTASGGGKKVLDTCYQSGLSCPAKKNLMWQSKGDWCITKSYINNEFNDKLGNGFAGKCPP